MSFMSVTIFVDTNVLVYRRDAGVAEKQSRAQAWMERLWAERTGRLSYQVLQEYYVTVTSKLKPGLEVEAARNDVRALLAWHPVTVDAAVVESAWAVQDRYGLSWWDAQIVAAAQAADCQFLLTEDLQEGQVLGAVRVVNPFSNLPDSILSKV
jgi:predicted nucleic acid-binding protein